MSDPFPHPSVCRAFAVLTAAQKGQVPGAIADCEAAVCEAAAVLWDSAWDDTPDVPAYGEAPASWEAAERRWVEARTKLRTSAAEVEHLLGANAVPRAMPVLAEFGLYNKLTRNPRGWTVGVFDWVWDALTDLDALRVAASEDREKRPTEPTADYCLPGGLTVRWDGETKLSPILHRALKFLLTRGGQPFPQTELEDELWGDEGTGDKNLANTLSKLNKAIELTGIPWRWRARGGYIRRKT